MMLSVKYLVYTLQDWEKNVSIKMKVHFLKGFQRIEPSTMKSTQKSIILRVFNCYNFHQEKFKEVFFFLFLKS